MSVVETKATTFLGFSFPINHFFFPDKQLIASEIDEEEGGNQDGLASEQPPDEAAGHLRPVCSLLLRRRGRREATGGKQFEDADHQPGDGEARRCEAQGQTDAELAGRHLLRSLRRQGTHMFLADTDV
jgi:hypothetical protein